MAEREQPEGTFGELPEEFGSLSVQEVKQSIGAAFAYSILVTMKDAGYSLDEARLVAENAATIFGIGLPTLGDQNYATTLYGKSIDATDEERSQWHRDLRARQSELEHPTEGTSVTRFLHWLENGTLPGEPMQMSHGSHLSWVAKFASMSAVEVIFTLEAAQREREHQNAEEHPQGQLIDQSGHDFDIVPGGFYPDDDLEADA